MGPPGLGPGILTREQVALVSPCESDVIARLDHGPRRYRPRTRYLPLLHPVTVGVSACSEAMKSLNPKEALRLNQAAPRMVTTLVNMIT